MAPRKNDSCSVKRANLWTIKKPDGEPLLRYDIQWQVLEDIFNDRTFRFTAPVDQASAPEPPVYLNFDQLYLESILSATKVSQQLRQKLLENSQFATAFCKLSLLVNIGRVNTTLAFYASMKTALRTYHPVPSLQQDETSRRDMQDAPRIRAILKSCMLDWEVNAQPTCLRDIAEKSASPSLSRGPPSTVVGTLFHLFNEANWVTDKYFAQGGFDLLDIFYPSDMPSAPRARAFLLLLHHVLENKSFIHDFSNNAPVDLSPPIVLIREPAHPQENIDPPHELQYVQEVQAIRSDVVKTTPAIQKRDEELQAKAIAQAQAATLATISRPDEAVDGHAAVARGPGARQPRTRSYARSVNEQAAAGRVLEILPPGWENEDWTQPPQSSSLPSTWLSIKRDQMTNTDPDYDSDEEGAWSYDLLRRRQLLTVVNPATGQRGPVTEVKEYAEWMRRQQEALAERQDLYAAH